MILLGGPIDNASGALLDTQELFISIGGHERINVSRHPILDYSVIVSVNGIRQSSFVDYSCDAGGGAITFLRSLKAQDSIDVAYQYDSTKASTATRSIDSRSGICMLNNTRSDEHAQMGVGVCENIKTHSGLSLVSTAEFDPDNPTPNTHTKKLGACVRPVPPLTLEASSTTTSGPTGDSNLTSFVATLDSPWQAKVVASVTDTSNATIQTDVDSFSVATDTRKSICLDGNVKLRDTTSTTPDNSLTTLGTDATIKIARPLQLRGIYCQHPDDSGLPADLVRTGMAVVTTVGCVSLTTNYAVDERTQASNDIPDSKFGVTGKVDINKMTCLTGQYQDTNHCGYADRVRAYTIGLTRNVAGALHISVTSCVDVTGSNPGGQAADTKTTASLGMKF